MAKTSLVEKAKKLKRKYLIALAAGRKPKMGTRVYNRCNKCGRPHGYIRIFDMCRICIREAARKGEIAGLRKSSW
ncbi:type Z 30S ribosomal protein S14 [Candidatus Peregrinibacteria bacterium]|nr:type Z 30S ribosomal protein S14 [Candidatus Peregrinibacteria bacterium]